MSLHRWHRCDRYIHFSHTCPFGPLAEEEEEEEPALVPVEDPDVLEDRVDATVSEPVRQPVKVPAVSGGRPGVGITGWVELITDFVEELVPALSGDYLDQFPGNPTPLGRVLSSVLGVVGTDADGGNGLAGDAIRFLGVADDLGRAAGSITQGLADLPDFLTYRQEYANFAQSRPPGTVGSTPAGFAPGLRGAPDASTLIGRTTTPSNVTMSRTEQLTTREVGRWANEKTPSRNPSRGVSNPDVQHVPRSRGYHFDASRRLDRLLGETIRRRGETVAPFKDPRSLHQIQSGGPE